MQRIKSFRNLLDEIERSKVKSRLKSAFRRKKRLSKVIIPDEDKVATKKE